MGLNNGFICGIVMLASEAHNDKHFTRGGRERKSIYRMKMMTVN